MEGRGIYPKCPQCIATIKSAPPEASASPATTVSRGGHLEDRELRGSEPQTRDHDEQKANFGDADARVVSEAQEIWVHTGHSSGPRPM